MQQDIQVDSFVVGVKHNDTVVYLKTLNNVSLERFLKALRALVAVLEHNNVEEKNA